MGFFLPVWNWIALRILLSHLFAMLRRFMSVVLGLDMFTLGYIWLSSILAGSGAVASFGCPES